MFFTSSYCLFCGKPLTQSFGWVQLFSREEQVFHCHDCEDQLQEIAGETCVVCNRPFAQVKKQYRHGELCYDCVRWEKDEVWRGVLKENHSIYVYNEFLTEVLAKYKFRGDYIISMAFKHKLQEKLTTLQYDCIVPIPLSEERLYERGFNQAVALIEATGQPYEQVLTRIHSEKQSKKSRHDRIQQAQVFSISHPSVVKQKNILLIDDIYTTGSTIRHAAKILKTNGAATVTSLTLARG